MGPWLLAGFFGTAVVYASVGFGGGSTYSALLSLAGFDYRLLPVIALLCNVVVVTGGTIRFARAAEMPWRGALVLSCIAAPLAFLGGVTPIREATFLAVLGWSLIVAGMALLVPTRSAAQTASRSGPDRLGLIPIVAAPLGYLAGLVGIGGGIFLAPLLHLLRWQDARKIAATCSLFILINSLAGLSGQWVKDGGARFVSALTEGAPLLAAVLIGGQIGSALAVRFLPVWLLRCLTAVLTIWAGSRLIMA